MEALLCFRLTTDTGSVAELWELDTGEFELLFVEAHRPQEVVYAATFRAVEVELLAEKLGVAVRAALTPEEPT
jgi:hypothetical protein